MSYNINHTGINCTETGDGYWVSDMQNININDAIKGGAAASLAFGDVDNISFTAIGDVPEPTSGLLLLLGVAGLALRRRRA